MAGSDPSPGSQPDRRQLLLVSLAVLALVAAAFFAPISPPDAGPDTDPEPGSGEDDRNEGSPGGNTGNGGEGAGGQNEPGEIDGTVTVNSRSIDGTGGGGGEPVDGEGRLRVEGLGDDLSCGLVLDSRPVPGTDLGVEVVRGGDPASGVTVWFNDRRIGTTGLDGRVSGQVPYERPLSIRVSFGDGAVCEGLARTPDSAALGLAPATADDADNDSTATVEVAVEAEMQVSVDASAFPGETVTVRATIEGVPVPDARVSVDGETVGRTGDGGSYDLTVPDDGRTEITVAARRGDFGAAAPVRVLDLDVGVRPKGLLALPGARGAVVVERGDDPYAGAGVAVDGQRIDVSDGDGTTDLRLPLNPGASITATTGRQTVSVDIASVYAGSAVIVSLYLLLVGGLARYAARSRGRQSALRVSGAGLSILAVVVAHAYAGTAGATAAGLVVGLGAVLWIGARRRETVASGGRSAAGFLRSVPRWVVGAVVATARWLEPIAGAVASGLARLARWLSRQPRSIPVLLARLAGFVRTVPGRLRAIPWRWLLVAVAAIASVGAAYALWDTPGAAVATVVLLGAAVALYGRRADDPSAATGTEPDETVTTPATGTESDQSDDDPSLRERWRTFARWVRPRRWPVSTPGEVARDARGEGYPEEAVRALTDAFRETEYGRRPASERVRQRGERAFRRLADHRDGGDEE